MRAIKVVLSIAVVLGVIPAGAFHDPGLPVLASTALASGDWARYELHAAEGASLDVEVFVELEGVRSAWAADWIIRPNGRGTGLMGFDGGRGIRVVSPLTGVVIEDPTFVAGEGAMGSASTYHGLSEGPITVIVGVVGLEGTIDGDVIISGTGIDVLSSATGTGTFLGAEEDFEPGTHVRAPMGALEVALDGSLTATTEDPLYAWFLTGHDISQTRYEGPARSETSTTTSGFGWIILDGEPAGEHRFILDHVAGAVFTGWRVVGVPAAGPAAG